VRRLGDIPIRVESAASSVHSTGTIGGGVSAILSEIASRLERFCVDAQPDAIDLRSLPMSPDDYDRLRQILGSGEVTVRVDADGESIIRETGVPGVWWNEHHDRAGETIAIYIEIARVPAMLPVDIDELRNGAQRLRALVSAEHNGTARKESDT